ncbi:MAG: phosphoglucosamine mutase [Candidatus Methanomethylicia archaeon]|nr:phosphoglucosamine mutase [Candidatus Methanomethylicia archaeon]MCX8169192.1 phosphoglucosamine mutase [Candidatus Methanomethylicia archaeon]MDW7989026.1 phosphoglucosamine mutase [Nitrososphaerota archaeon]
MGRLFGTNGIRGTIEELTPEFVAKIALAIGTYFNCGEIMLGYDGRKTSPILFRTVASSLMATGCKVYNAGMTTTPLLQFGVKSLKLDGGVMITASHNPPEFNGIKVIGSDGIEVPREIEEEIEEIFFNEKFSRRPWNEIGYITTAPNIIDDYLKSIKRNVNVKRISSIGYNVLIDPGNGVSILTIPKLLEELNCNYMVVNGHIDEEFPGRGAEPTPQTLIDVGRIVVKEECDFGVSYDGDGDRAIFIDDEGAIHWGDKTGAILVEYVLRKKGGGIIVTPISTSKIVEDVTEKFGGIIQWTVVGSVVVSHELKKVRGVMGLEDNGGILYPEHQYVRDGAMATAMMLDALTEGEGKLSKLISLLPKYYSIKKKVKCPNQLKNEVMRKLYEELTLENVWRIERIDGLKIWFGKNTWILVRPSGTEPIIRIYSEAKNLEEAEEISFKYERKLMSIIRSFGG